MSPRDDLRDLRRNGYPRLADELCAWCRGTGWRAVVDAEGYGYEEPCPNGCPQPELPPVEAS